jgi:Domain of unknown function (DUF3846)
MIALLIPADAAVPCRLVDVEDLAQTIGAEYFEQVRSWAGHSLALVVDEEGLLSDRPINTRVTGVLYPGVICGDVLVCREVHEPDGADLSDLTPALMLGLSILGYEFDTTEAVAR